MPRQDKVILQRRYREQESQYFDMLRHVINALTGEKLQTRQEILGRATDLLLTAPEVKEPRESALIHSTPHEIRELTVNSADGRSISMAHSADSSTGEYWQYAVEPDMQSVYYVCQTDEQQHQFAFNLLDSTYLS